MNAVKTGPNISKPFIRGLGYNRVLTLYDGVRQEGQQWGDEHGIEVDAYGLEKAEVIKGPSSISFGSDALAGVISLFPYLPKEKDGKVYTKITSEYQSNNGLIGNGFRVGYSSQKWLWAVRGSSRVASNYTNTLEGRVYNTGFNEKNFSTLIGYFNQKGFTRLNFTFYDNNQGIPDGSRDSLTRKFTKQIAEGILDDIKNRPIVSEQELNYYQLSPLHQHIQHIRVYANNHYIVGAGDIDALVAFSQNNRQEFTHPTMPSQAGLNVRLNTVNFKLVYNNFKLSKLEYSLGINGMLQNNAIQDATDFPIPNYNLSEISSFVYAHWKSNRWNITSGLSFDIRALKTEDLYTNLNSNTGFNQLASQNTMGAVLQQSSFTQNFNGLSASIGSTFRASEFVHFKFNIARGYRAPNIAEIASNGLDPGAHIVYVGNRNFVPETNLQQDVGITIESKSISASLSVFNNYVQHYIHLSQVVDAEGNPIELVQGNKTFQYQQASAQLYGFEGTINVSPKPLRGLSWRNAVSLVYGNNTKKEFENSGTLGQYLPFIPPLKIVSGLHQEVRLKTKQKQLLNFSFEMDYSAAQNRFLALYQTETVTPHYTLFDLSAGTEFQFHQKNGLQFQFQINNLFDEVYQSNLSRLKYFEYYSQSPTGRLGMFSMGRNVCIKVICSF